MEFLCLNKMKNVDKIKKGWNIYLRINNKNKYKKKFKIYLNIKLLVTLKLFNNKIYVNKLLINNKC